MNINLDKTNRSNGLRALAISEMECVGGGCVQSPPIDKGKTLPFDTTKIPGFPEPRIPPCTKPGPLH